MVCQKEYLNSVCPCKKKLAEFINLVYTTKAGTLRRNNHTILQLFTPYLFCVNLSVLYGLIIDFHEFLCNYTSISQYLHYVLVFKILHHVLFTWRGMVVVKNVCHWPLIYLFQSVYWALFYLFQPVSPIHHLVMSSLPSSLNISEPL